MSSSTNHIIKRPQVTVGEGVDPADFNNLAAAATYQHEVTLVGRMRRQLRSQQGPSSSAISPADGTDIGPAATLYAQDSDGAPRNGTGMNSYTCNPGTLYQVTGSPTVNGSTVVVPAYNLQAGEINGSFPIGDATYPRFDAVYVRLSVVDCAPAARNFEDAAGVKSGQNVVAYKETKLEWLPVTGTPAAHPLIPAAPDSTWVMWGVWMTFKNQNSAHSFRQLFDYRVPIGIRRLFAYPGAGMYAVGASCTANPANGQVTFSATGSAGWAGASCPVKTGRIMSFGVASSAYAGGAISVKARGLYGTYAPLASSNSIYGGIPTGQPTQGINDIDGYQLVGGVWLKSDGTHTELDPNGLQLLPLWANGFGNTTEDDSLDYANFQDTPQHVAMLFTPATTGEVLQGAFFDVAG